MTTRSVFDSRGADAPSRQLHEVLAPTVDEAQAQRMWNRIDRRPSSVRSSDDPWTPRGAWGILVALSLLAMALWVVRSSSLDEPVPAHLTLSSGEVLGVGPVAAADTARTLSFDEGSQVRLEAGAEWAVVNNADGSFVTALRAGRARFSITPGGPRRWVVDAGELTVEVVGTVFSVDRRPHGTRVEVERGQVVVRGAIPGGERRVLAGQHVETKHGVEEPAVTPRSASEAGVHVGDPDPQSALSASESAAPPGEPLTLAQLEAASGNDDAVLNEGEAAHGVGVKVAQHSVGSAASADSADSDDLDQLLVIADAAKLEGELEVALKALKQVVEQAPAGDPRRGIAALSYSRLVGNPESERWALAAGVDALPAGLRAAALLRLVRVSARLGRRDEATRWAQRYRQEFPHDANHPEVSPWLSGD